MPETACSNSAIMEAMSREVVGTRPAISTSFSESFVIFSIRSCSLFSYDSALARIPTTSPGAMPAI